jgi:hypothetical protein
MKAWNLGKIRSWSEGIWTRNFWCFDIWGIVAPGGITHPGIGQFLEEVNNLYVFPIKTNQSWAHIPSHHLYWTLHSELLWYPSALITPGPGTRQLGTVFMSQGLLKFFKLATRQPAYPASLVLPAETTIEALLQFAHLSASCLPPPLYFPVRPTQDVACLHLLGSVSNNYLLNGSSLLNCWTHQAE